MQYWLDINNNCIHGKVKDFIKPGTYNTKCPCCGWSYYLHEAEVPKTGSKSRSKTPDFACRFCAEPPVYAGLAKTLEVSG